MHRDMKQIRTHENGSLEVVPNPPTQQSIYFKGTLKGALSGGFLRGYFSSGGS